MTFVSGHPVDLPLLLVALVGGYLSGSVPYGLILTRLAGLGDIRAVGSGNIGATNVLRAGGKKLGAATLILDALKGYVPVAVAGQFGLDYAIITALAAFCGHLFPVWLKFKGGKGVATGIGVSFGLAPGLGLAICLMWLSTAIIGRYSSLAALTAFAMAPLMAWIVTHEIAVVVSTALVSLVIFIRHRDNIKRLINGTESKIGQKTAPSA